MNADYSALNEKTQTNPKAFMFKLNNRIGIIKYKNIFSKSYTETCSRETFVVNSVLRTNLSTSQSYQK